MTTIHEYHEFVRELFVKKNTGPDGFMHAASGYAGEAGEVLDMVKKHWVYDAPLDKAKMLEEMGDGLWYFFQLMNLLETDIWEVIAGNVEKLRKRYPDGYTDKAAIARRDMVVGEHPNGFAVRDYNT